MEKRWVLKETDSECEKHLKEVLNIHPLLIQMLVQRGIRSYDDAKYFFRPLLDHLHNPFLMADMIKAVERVTRAMRDHEKILIYGDYDVDGTTSVALVYSFLKELGVAVDYYVPNRYSEGYGISKKGIDFAKDQGFTLVIALDCGIKANDKIEYANERQVDFIICDHHLPGDEIPPAIAVLDPKRKDCGYPFKELSGCGIGFKLISALAMELKLPMDQVYKFLDYVVVSIASDIVPITGENRVLAYYGLQKLNQKPCDGLRALIELSSQRKSFSISDVVFLLGPRINAAGRINDARDAVRLLISGIELASSHARLLNKHNQERKDHDLNITRQAKEMLDKDHLQNTRKTTVLFDKDWHKGVIGIVASRLIESWYRPTIIFTESNGMLSGSARSVRGFDIHEAIYNCRDLLEQFGGHMFAAGLTLKPENLEAFRNKFEDIVASTIEERYLTPEIEINAELHPKDITPKFFNILQQLAPFGPSNMKPVFVTHGVIDKGWSRVVGNDHLKLSIEKDGTQLSGMAFGYGKHLEKVKSGKPFDICYTLEENEWEGRKKIEMLVTDLR
ncbi:MAG: single-stranded-DNA-specific exonuclease RecJ [Chitinophagales bacterium]